MFTEEEKSAPLSFISNMVRSWLPSYANWAILRKEICRKSLVITGGGLLRWKSCELVSQYTFRRRTG